MATVNAREAPRLPLPPCDAETAARKVRLAEDAWSARNPERVSLACTRDTVWRNRAEFLTGREAIVRCACEWHDDSGRWLRSYGNENWEFDASGYMRRRIAGINDLPIAASERQYHWPPGRRPHDHPGLSELGL